VEDEWVQECCGDDYLSEFITLSFQSMVEHSREICVVILFQTNNKINEIDRTTTHSNQIRRILVLDWWI